MRKTKMQNGITLVALIITIIVLLILAVVSISVVSDSGIISRAKNAQTEYEIGEEKEKINLALDEWYIQKNTPSNTKTFKEVVENALSNTVTVSGDDNGPLTITMNDTGNQYTVTDEGETILVEKGISISPAELSLIVQGTQKITVTLTGGLKAEDVVYSSSDKNVATVSEDGTVTGLAVGEATITVACDEYSVTCKVIVEEKSDVDELAKYILGADKAGRVILGENGIMNDSLIFQKDPADETSTVHEKVKLASVTDTELYIRYNRDVYKFNYLENDNSIASLENTLTLVNAPTGNLGKYVTYANNTWIVLKDDASGVELISANGLGALKIEQAAHVGYAAARTNYNNAVEIIVNKCKTVTEESIRSNIRSVGSTLTAEETLSDTNTVDFSELETFSPSVEDSKFAQYEGATNGLRKADTNYESDYALMESLGILATDTPAEYWLASRYVEESSDEVYFNVRKINMCSLDDFILFSVTDQAHVPRY